MPDTNTTPLQEWSNLEKGIVRDPLIFTKDYVPKKLLYRDLEVKKMIKYMHSGKDIIVTGLPSVGKTAMIRYLFKDLSNLDEPIEFLYVNCRDKTKAETLCSIVESFGGNAKTSGWSVTHYHRELNRIIKKKGLNRVYLCLDEYDTIAKKYKGLDGLLYYFCNGSIFKLILISNINNCLDYADERTKARLFIKHLHLPQYSKYQTREILKHRLRRGVGDEDFLTEKELNHITQLTFDHIKKLRIGIEVLSDIVQKKSEIGRELEIDEIDTIFNQKDHNLRRDSLQNLPTNHKYLLYILIHIKRRKEEGANIFATKSKIKWYWDKNKEDWGLKERTKQTLWNYLKYLKEFNLIRERRIDDKSVGRPKKEYIPNFDTGLFTLELSQKEE